VDVVKLVLYLVMHKLLLIVIIVKMLLLNLPVENVNLVKDPLLKLNIDLYFTYSFILFFLLFFLLYHMDGYPSDHYQYLIKGI
jgi:hypothetical protein